MIESIKYEHPKIFGKAITTESNGFYLLYNKTQYIIGIHHGYPVSDIIISNNKDSISNYTICHWNELLFKSVNTLEDQFVFNNFSKKHIDSSGLYYSDTKRFKYVGKHYFPINMFPNNPKNLYYTMECINDTIKAGDSGSPVYDSNQKVIGIISKIKKKYVYVIPIIYLINAFNKKDNHHTYTIDNNNPRTVDMYNVNDNTIYHPSLKSYISLEAFMILEGDKDKKVLVNNMDNMYVKMNNMINTCNYIIHNNKILITTGLLCILKLINKELLIMIFKNFKNRLTFKYGDYELVYILNDT